MKWPELDAVTLDIVAPLLPRFQRPIGLGRNARLAPQRKRGAGDLPPCRAVGLVRRKVVGGPGAIVVAGGVDVFGRRVVQAVLRQRFLAEGRQVLRFRPAGNRVVEIAHRVLLDEHFGQRIGLGEEEPVIGLHRQLHGEIVPHRMRRHDVEHGQAADGRGCVERHAVGHARAAIMAHDSEARMPERGHQRQQVLRHGAFRIGLVLRVVGRAGGIAIAAQVRHHAGEVTSSGPAPRGATWRASAEIRGSAEAAGPSLRYARKSPCR